MCATSSDIDAIQSQESNKLIDVTHLIVASRGRIDRGEIPLYVKRANDQRPKGHQSCALEYLKNCREKMSKDYICKEDAAEDDTGAQESGEEEDTDLEEEKEEPAGDGISPKKKRASPGMGKRKKPEAAVIEKPKIMGSNKFATGGALGNSLIKKREKKALEKTEAKEPTKKFVKKSFMKKKKGAEEEEEEQGETKVVEKPVIKGFNKPAGFKMGGLKAKVPPKTEKTDEDKKEEPEKPPAPVKKVLLLKKKFESPNKKVVEVKAVDEDMKDEAAKVEQEDTAEASEDNA